MRCVSYVSKLHHVFFFNAQSCSQEVQTPAEPGPACGSHCHTNKGGCYPRGPAACVPGWSWLLLEQPPIKLFQLLYETGPNNLSSRLEKNKAQRGGDVLSKVMQQNMRGPGLNPGPLVPEATSAAWAAPPACPALPCPHLRAASPCPAPRTPPPPLPVPPTPPFPASWRERLTYWTPCFCERAA